MTRWSRGTVRVYHFNYRFDQWVFLPVVDGYQLRHPELPAHRREQLLQQPGRCAQPVEQPAATQGPPLPGNHRRACCSTPPSASPGCGTRLPPWACRARAKTSARPWASTAYPGGAYLVLPILGPSNLRDTGGLLVDYTAESQINFLNVSEVSSNHPEIWALRAVDKRYQTSFRYGQMNSPFEYEKVRYSVYAIAQVADCRVTYPSCKKAIEAIWMAFFFRLSAAHPSEPVRTPLPLKVQAPDADKPDTKQADRTLPTSNFPVELQHDDIGFPTHPHGTHPSPRPRRLNPKPQQNLIWTPPEAPMADRAAIIAAQANLQRHPDPQGHPQNKMVLLQATSSISSAENRRLERSQSRPESRANAAYNLAKVATLSDGREDFGASGPSPAKRSARTGFWPVRQCFRRLGSAAVQGVQRKRLQRAAVTPSPSRRATPCSLQTPAPAPLPRR